MTRELKCGIFANIIAIALLMASTQILETLNVTGSDIPTHMNGNISFADLGAAP